MSRAHQTEERKLEGDRVFTPDWVAADMVSTFRPHGLVLEPCRGDGAIYNKLGPGTLWCESDEGRDFFAFNEPVDWILSNPPYSKTRPFMRHSFRLADNVVFLVPARNIVAGYGTVCEARAFGNTRQIRWYGTGNRLGFPMGNAIAAFHWSRGYRGSTLQTFYDDGVEIFTPQQVKEGDRLCGDCPPTGHPTDKTRCTECPRRVALTPTEGSGS